MTLAERLKLIRKSQNPSMTQAQFAASLGHKREAYSAYETGRATPTPSTIKLVCLTYGVNPRWLETGEGEMLVEDDSDDDLLEQVRTIMTADSAYGARVMASLARMPDEWWDRWRAEMDKLDRKGRG